MTALVAPRRAVGVLLLALAACGARWPRPSVRPHPT